MVGLHKFLSISMKVCCFLMTSCSGEFWLAMSNLHLLHIPRILRWLGYGSNNVFKYWAPKIEWFDQLNVAAKKCHVWSQDHNLSEENGHPVPGPMLLVLRSSWICVKTVPNLSSDSSMFFFLAPPALVHQLGMIFSNRSLLKRSSISRWTWDRPCLSCISRNKLCCI